MITPGIGAGDPRIAAGAVPRSMIRCDSSRITCDVFSTSAEAGRHVSLRTGRLFAAQSYIQGRWPIVHSDNHIAPRTDRSRQRLASFWG